MKAFFVMGGLLLLLALSGCTELPSKENANQSNLLVGTIVTDAIKKGNYVTLYYKGTLDDGSIFDQTTEENPAVFQVGVGALIEGFDNGLLGMKVGEKKKIVIPPALAYGEFDPSRIVQVERKQLEDANVPILVGVTVGSSAGQGIIRAIDENTEKVSLDFNHPLAGKTLTFDVEILKIDNKP